MKVTLVGGGGFRTPLVEEALATMARGVVEELVLHDVDEERRRLVAAVLEAVGASVGTGRRSRRPPCSRAPSRAPARCSSPCARAGSPRG